MVKKYKTKPCEIEAMRFTRNIFEEMVIFTNGNASHLTVERRPGGKAHCNINTLEGIMIATEGDYIIKGLRGEFYPCKPDVFEKKYEAKEEKVFKDKFTDVKDVNKLYSSSIISNEPINTIKSNILTINVKATEIDEVKNIIASFIFMLEDSRIDKDIRLQYLESCKELKEQYFVRIDK